MFYYITLKTWILVLICAGSSIQEPFHCDLFLKKPVEVPKPFQFLSLFGVYNENKEQEDLKQAEQDASQSNKQIQNPGSLIDITGTDQRKETTDKANHQKLGLNGSLNPILPGRNPFIEASHVLRIQPSFLIDRIKQLFFNALQPFGTSLFKTANTESINKSINPNQPMHKDKETREESKLPGNDKKTFQGKNQEREKNPKIVEKDQQFLNFNDTFRNSKFSSEKKVSDNPLDRISFPPDNETYFMLDKLYEVPINYSDNPNETFYLTDKIYEVPTDNSDNPESDKILDSPAADLIIKPALDVREEFQEPDRTESGSTNNTHLDEFSFDQTNQPTYESYKMNHMPDQSENKTVTSEQFNQLFQKPTNQPTLVFSNIYENVESSTNKVVNGEELNDFVIDLTNQSILELEKILRDHELSENSSANNTIFKKSIDSESILQLLESDSPDLNSELNTNETTGIDQFEQISHESNKPNGNISKIFRKPEVIRSMTHITDRPDLANLFQNNQPTTIFNEKLDIYRKIKQKNDQYDLIPHETNQPNVSADRVYQNPEVASSTIDSKDDIDQNTFIPTNQPTFNDTLQVTELDTRETVRADQFSKLNSESNEPNTDSSKVFRNSGATIKATISNIHQFTVPQTYQSSFDFEKLFQDPQASTVLETNNDVYEVASSLIPNLVETTFESNEESKISDIPIYKPDTNNSFKESNISKTSETETEFFKASQELEESTTFIEFIYDEKDQTTTELDKSSQDKYISKSNEFSDGMFENSIMAQTDQTEVKFTEAFQELDLHLNEYTILNNYDQETDQSTFATSKIFRNPQEPEIAENDFFYTIEEVETTPGFFQLDKSTAKSAFYTADVIGRETYDTTLISDQVTAQLDTHKFFTDSVPLDFTINLPSKTSDTDYNEQKNLKKEIFSNEPHNEHQFLYPLCSEGSNIKKLAPCDSENKFFMCNDASSGTIKRCNRTKPKNEIPLCFLDLSSGRFLVSCSTFPKKMCLYESEVETAVRFCREPETAICIDERNKLQFCQTTRFKRQGPKVPNLDQDAYYANCGNCKLQVGMYVREDQRPVVKIRSEPNDPDNAEESKE